MWLSLIYEIHHWMYFLHAINSDRQTRLLNVLGQIAMILGDKKKLKWNRQLLNLYSFGSECVWLAGGMILATEDGISRTKTGPIASFFTTNSTYTGLDWNPVLLGERLVSNRLIPLVANLIYIQKAVGPLRPVRLHQILYIRPVQMSNLTTVLCGEMCVWYTK